MALLTPNFTIGTEYDNIKGGAPLKTTAPIFIKKLTQPHSSLQARCKQENRKKVRAETKFTLAMPSDAAVLERSEKTTINESRIKLA